jgi:16S rRNA processing protein RimM
VAAPHGERLTLARIVRARGTKGEVAAEILTDFPERLTKLREVWLVPPVAGAAERKARLRNVWLATSRGGQVIFHFEGCDSIPEAQALVGCEVQVAFAERAKLPKGKHYVNDLVGCEVYEAGERLGAVRDVQFTGGSASLLVVEGASGEILIPLAEGICVLVDPAARRIEVILPEGLRDLNQ